MINNQIGLNSVKLPVLTNMSSLSVSLMVTTWSIQLSYSMLVKFLSCALCFHESLSTQEDLSYTNYNAILFVKL